MWNDFEHYRAAALDARRARQHASDLHARCEAPAEATENFDLITYEKGAVGGAHDRALPRRRRVPRRRAHVHAPPSRAERSRRRPLARARGSLGTRGVARGSSMDREAWIPCSCRCAAMVEPSCAFARNASSPTRSVGAARRRTSWPLPLVVKRPGTDGDEVDRFWSMAPREP